MLCLYNSLSQKVEQFNPLKQAHVGMYTCGPTVYDFMHIGNLRTFILSDVLHRALKQNGYQVKAAQNITDIDDKIIKRAQESELTVKQLADQYADYFYQDIKKLNVDPDGEVVHPQATEYIPQMVNHIKALIDKQFAYVESDGSVYFDISQFKNYGRLSRLDQRSLKPGTRALSDEYDKDDARDFALWKRVKDDDQIGFDSPWGRGRPGWHIECSVMSQQLLGNSFDIHVGGVDLLFPHHENEIAQSEARTGQQFARFFVHCEHLLVEGQKMSKSLKNFYTLKDLAERSFEPLAFRYLVLTAHYRDKLNFTWKSLEASQNALSNLRDIIRDWDEPKIGCAGYEQEFMKSVNNDLNSPQGLAVLWKMVRSDYPTSAKAESILAMDKVLGLKLEEYLGKGWHVYQLNKSGGATISHTPLNQGTVNLIDDRELARKAGDFDRADELRKQIKGQGFEIEDTSRGTIIKKGMP